MHENASSDWHCVARGSPAALERGAWLVMGKSSDSGSAPAGSVGVDGHSVVVEQWPVNRFEVIRTTSNMPVRRMYIPVQRSAQPDDHQPGVVGQDDAP
jgi:hypothetical protein